MPKRLTDDDLRELLERSRRGEDECWPWQGALAADGYGRFGGRARAHREVYRLLVGPIPAGQVIRHRCDNPPCVNYLNHLVLGTQLENIRDRDVRGRNGLVKLTVDQVVEIRALYAAGGVLQRELAERYGVSMGAITDATQGRLRNWALGPLDSIQRPREEWQPRGEKSGRAKLTEAQVREIRELHTAGVRNTELAARFGVSKVMIGKIVKRTSWADVV